MNFLKTILEQLQQYLQKANDHFSRMRSREGFSTKTVEVWRLESCPLSVENGVRKGSQPSASTTIEVAFFLTIGGALEVDFLPK